MEQLLFPKNVLNFQVSDFPGGGGQPRFGKSPKFCTFSFWKASLIVMLIFTDDLIIKYRRDAARMDGLTAALQQGLTEIIEMLKAAGNNSSTS